MRINKKEVEHVALLARLQLSKAEADNYTEQLNSILGWVEKLNQLDISEVEPTSHVLPMSNVFREDKVTTSFGIEKVLANAPDSKENFFRVPKIV
ncbi:MAG: glutamyl-tRNA amidotransferase [Desulfitibacter sp. BRH_c19]|nr:MAG: glutamyl-tRNA amidotransferase [Desulfitibacter sp. BRH_c19]